MPIAKTPPSPSPSFTVWSYDYDAAPFHVNELSTDTFQCRNQAMRVARRRVRETNHDTGWAKIIDNTQAGRMGDNGVIVLIKKTRHGGARTVYRR